MDGAVDSTAEEDEKRSQKALLPAEVHGRQPAHQRFVFTDPAAFRYLEEDPSTTVLGRQCQLDGYELYIVEQWACSRIDPTFVITTYTGHEQHTVLVSVLGIPTDEGKWSLRLRVYFRAIAKYHARKKETALGMLMVTNLSGFPSALNVIKVPDGDLKKHREDFFVNENLKRLGCAGRAGLSLARPVQATEAKFLRLYRTSEKISLYSAVIELVKLCQVALMLFGELAPEYADGLLCDVTEKAINEWWAKVGTKIFEVEPHDGILGPTTVAALLGTLQGARNRLHAYGAPVAKDVFDIASTKRGIGYFQKSQKLPRTRRLDWTSLDHLHTATAKAAKSTEGWTMPRAVKSTVAELSGKGHELAANEAREKASITDIETLDIETFVQLASGERSKWLWYGKPRKRQNSDVFRHLGSDDGMVREQDPGGEYLWSKKQRDSVLDDPLHHTLLNRIHTQSAHESGLETEPTDKEQAPRRTVLKNVAGRMTDAKSGFDRIKSAVGKRGHHHRHSKEAASLSDGDSLRERLPRNSDENTQIPSSAVSSSYLSSATAVVNRSLSNTPPSPRSRRQSSVAEEGIDQTGSSMDMFNKTHLSDTYGPWELAVESESERDSGDVSEAGREVTYKRNNKDPKTSSKSSKELSISVDRPSYQALTVKHDEVWKQIRPNLEPNVALPRTQSLPRLPNERKEYFNQYRWPRHLSFSVAVDVVSAANDGISETACEKANREDAHAALLWEIVKDFDMQTTDDALTILKNQDGAWVKQKVGDIEDLDAQCDRDQENLDAVHRQKLEEHHALQQASDELLVEEKASLGEAVKYLDTLSAKLEYELNVLQSRVEDVENAALEFERQVTQVEWRTEELHMESSARHNWLQLPLRLFSFRKWNGTGGR
ncbi:MAG: hypothetical protein LQ342_000521 [Letrouitia transgressa]|nr:MAG: hypothetical protein LQ342_000521 [Letrouitia transgressa]